MQKKQNSVIDIILLALAVILLAAVVGVNLGESSLITELGIRGFRWLSRGLIGEFVLSAVVCGGRLIKRGLSLNQLKMEEQKRLEQAEEQKLLEEKRGCHTICGWRNGCGNGPAFAGRGSKWQMAGLLRGEPESARTDKGFYLCDDRFSELTVGRSGYKVVRDI